MCGNRGGKSGDAISMRTQSIIIAAVSAFVCLTAGICVLIWIYLARDASLPLAGAKEEAPVVRVPPPDYTSEGFALLHRQRKPAEAIAAFEACVREYPNHSDGYHGLAQAQREAGDPASALANHDRAIRLDPTRHGFYWERGVTQARLKNYEEAITNFVACLERNPRFGNAQLGLAEAYRNLGDFQTALAHHEKAIDLNPQSAWFHRERGNTYQRMGDRPNADADFAKARELERNKQ
jgi:tetratricopeptide (TPR) repeat protein